MAAIAGRQGGVLSRGQLLEAGLSSSGIHRRVREGMLHPIHRGVYVLGHKALAPHAHEWAALLACGGRAVISHASAAAIWSLIDRPADAPVDVIVGRRHVRSREGVRAHRGRLTETDVRLVDGLPTTSPMRTIVDLAASDHPDLERALSEAQVRKLIRPRDLRTLVQRSRRRRGARRLRSLIDAERLGFTRSEAERRLRNLLRQARLPQPRTNARVAGYEVDFFWPEHELIVEVDGFAAHGHRRAFERDRRKDAALNVAGYRVIRITWNQLAQEPLMVAAMLGSALTAA